MLAAALAAPFTDVGAGGLDPCDESYQALCTATYREQPAAPAVFAVGALWQRLFGHDALTLRYLGVLSMLLSLAIGALWYYLRRGNALQACALMLTASLTASTAVFNIYNWDTGAYPAQACALVAALGLSLRPRLWKCALLGALCAWAALCRVQLAVYLPLALWLAAASMPGRRLRAAAVTAVAFAVAWLAGSAIIFGSPAGHLHAILGGNFISGHTPANWRYILYRAWLDLLDLPLAWLPLVAAAAAAAVMHRLAPAAARAAALPALLAAGWVFLAAAVTATFYDGIIFAGDLPLFLIVALLPWVPGAHNVPRRQILICAVSVALTAFGSDAIAERYFPGYALAPLVAVTLPSLGRRGRRLLWGIVLFSAFAGASTMLVRHIMAERSHTCAMDRFPLQRGLRGTAREYAAWSALDAEIAARRGKRLKFVCRPYGLLLCYGDTLPPQAELHNFHFHDGDAGPEYDPSGRPLYDAYIFTLATPAHMPLTLESFGRAGYTLAPQARDTAEGEYFILETH